MKYKRILAGAFALALVLPLLTVSAHPGRTDKNGGHTDTGTGDYHYHHGHDAHAHFDIDGNGTIDCPYDFVDATDHSSGTRSSGSYTPGDGSEDGYQEGYADGYKKGEKEGELSGHSAGYADGYAKAEAEYKKLLRDQEEQSSQQYDRLLSGSLWTGGLLAALFLGSVLLLRIHEKMSEAKLKEVQSDCTRTVDRLSRDYALQIAALNADHEAEMGRIKGNLTKELSKLSGILRVTRRFNILDKIAAGEDPDIKLPEDIRLKQSFTPIKGRISEQYPYGEYTVFLSPLGTTYHCRHTCVPSARPMHFFDLTGDIKPCGRCVKAAMLPQPRPEWYIQIRRKLDQEQSRTEDRSGPEPVYYLEASNGMTVRAPESQLSQAADQDRPKSTLTPEQREQIKQVIKQRIYGDDSRHS